MKNLIFIFILLVFGCSNVNNQESLPYYNDPTFTPHWLQPKSDSVKGFHKIPSFELTNQNGKTITEKDIDGKITVVDFFFTTCPGICPRMTKNMVVIQEEFLEDNNIILLSHSVTPDKDSVPRLAEYASTKGVNSKRWHLLTGEREIIYGLGRKWYFVEEDLGVNKNIDDFLHTENFVLLDGNRQIRGIYNGLNKTSINQLIEDINTLKKEF